MVQARLPPAILFAGLIEQAVERLLALDGRHADLLAPIVGKHIVLDIRLPPLRLHLVPTASTIQIHGDLPSEPDVVIAGSLLGLIRMKFSDSPQLALFGGDVHIEGDMKVARHFQNLLDRLDIDWEGLLAGQIGAAAAGRLLGLAGAGRQWLAESFDAIRLDTAEYLQEEARELPASEEAEQLFRDIDELRADADRLEARLQRLLESPVGEP